MSITSGYIKSDSSRGFDCPPTVEQQPDIRKQLSMLALAVEMLEKSVELAASKFSPVLDDSPKGNTPCQENSALSVPAKTGLGREIQGLGDRVNKMVRAINYMSDDAGL